MGAQELLSGLLGLLLRGVQALSPRPAQAQVLQ
jgi:hypothetical protein